MEWFSCCGVAQGYFKGHRAGAGTGTDAGTWHGRLGAVGWWTQAAPEEYWQAGGGGWGSWVQA